MTILNLGVKTVLTQLPMFVHKYNILNNTDIHHGFEKIGQVVGNCWNWTKEVNV